MRLDLILPVLLLAGACDRNDPAPRPSDKPSAAAPAVDPLAARDGEAMEPDDKPREIMQVQVVLDRLGFTPGVVDGKTGLSTRNALRGFQEARGLPVTGEFDPATRQALDQYRAIPATRVVTVPAEFAAGDFRPVPDTPEDQARQPALGYATLDEKLAERFHTTVAVLRELNGGPTPTASAASPDETQSLYRAGQQLRVPNVGADRIDPGKVKDRDWLATLTTLGIGTAQPAAARIVVDKSDGTLRAYDAADRLVAMFTATMGSEHDPLPLGRWKVNGVATNPRFHYNPDLFWDADAGDEKATLPPGPNGPVGVVWIDLSKPHYGIHGTPHPETIGRAESHGCVRLTNWDAARLALMVRPGTAVLFEA